IAASFVEPPPPPLPSPQPSGPDKPVRPPPPPPTGPISVGEAEQARKLIHKVTPQYPQIAKALRIQGTVVLEVVIRADGLVKSTRVLSGGKTALSEAAQSAVRAWRYAPTMQNGYLMEVKTQVEIKFTL
ncbi:MAG: energy transducer TonB, partial [Verrucomicrobia bacterium]|nr:energy transducer TonB [Verrucomicrobiota bacterium]